ncbi:MAG: class I SAM-dependent methyltransferase [Acidimicrobiales bacterium]
MTADKGSYWRSADEDEAMQDEHGFVWRSMLDTIDTNLAARRVLDAGCNRGGFLRLLSDRAGIAQGFGYDPAWMAIEDARRLAGSRPLRFEVTHTVPGDWRGFDAAFSHEVLYLIHELSAHALAIFDALAPGGSYHAVMGVHDASPLMVEWHRQQVDELDLPPLYSIDEVVDVFQAVGFQAAVARLKMGFIPARDRTADHDSDPTTGRDLLRWLDYYNDEKLLLRFTRPDA